MMGPARRLVKMASFLRQCVDKAFNFLSRWECLAKSGRFVPVANVKIGSYISAKQKAFLKSSDQHFIALGSKWPNVGAQATAHDKTKF